ncbi:MAG: hypothetical protein US86_C0007G0001 [Candidatus Daviesbacteria bacterium GW2011_GWA2_38_24]|uniref:Uncharacterized protein n=1 Tax=Candidatus Daviesbacteria bacterium GW2011_GWA2_38_24 TaxID=1618422 RepID=A0A0G0MM01_9BACT|nr:MAG: hypothetical protein US86_C0007G0001 [Candidatus Daviesbacteria bacterium GW2011_GWA2_38_24]KKQ80846.1 MAG: hypothetical protein UT01_C0005G0001 [Candidatus Daviesbacteria bacterium GW2011_GWA1_38_7]
MLSDTKFNNFLPASNNFITKSYPPAWNIIYVVELADAAYLMFSIQGELTNLTIPIVTIADVLEYEDATKHLRAAEEPDSFFAHYRAKMNMLALTDRHFHEGIHTIGLYRPFRADLQVGAIDVYSLLTRKIRL